MEDVLDAPIPMKIVGRIVGRIVPDKPVPRSWPSTEKTLEWCRARIPGFATAERQALSARAAKREAAG